MSFKRPLIVVGIILGILTAIALVMTYLSGVPTDVYSTTG
jgi:hypothetical protein